MPPATSHGTASCFSSSESCSCRNEFCYCGRKDADAGSNGGTFPSLDFHGEGFPYAPAFPTPFKESDIDCGAFERLCQLQIEAGATALVVAGTTGESSTLIPSEHSELVRIAVGVAKGRVPVIAGAGSNSTSHAIELGKDSEAAGADAILSVVPYYNKPTQACLFAHFSAIAGSAGLPIILYNVPSRMACGLCDDTVARLAEIPSFIGLKDATGDMTRPLRVRSLVGPDFRLVSGDDATALPILAQGGNGCISVTSNVAPGLCRSMFLALRHGQMARAQRLAATLAQLHCFGRPILSRSSMP